MRGGDIAVYPLVLCGDIQSRYPALFTAHKIVTPLVMVFIVVLPRPAAGVVSRCRIERQCL